MKTANMLPTATCLFLAVFSVLGAARASTTYSGVQDIPLPDTFDGIYLDFTNLNDASVFTQASSEPVNWDINFFFAGAGIANSDTFSPVLESGLVNSPVSNRPFSSVVDLSSVVHGDFSVSTDHIDAGGLIPEFNNGTEGFIGFLIDFSGSEYAGWMRVTLNDDGNAGTLHEWAWETTPVISAGSIVVGIPEPSSAILMLGGLGTLLLRSRRRTRS